MYFSKQINLQKNIYFAQKKQKKNKTNMYLKASGGVK